MDLFVSNLISPRIDISLIDLWADGRKIPNLSRLYLFTHKIIGFETLISIEQCSLFHIRSHTIRKFSQTQIYDFALLMMIKDRSMTLHAEHSSRAHI